MLWKLFSFIYTCSLERFISFFSVSHSSAESPTASLTRVFSTQRALGFTHIHFVLPFLKHSREYFSLANSLQFGPSFLGTESVFLAFSSVNGVFLLGWNGYLHVWSSVRVILCLGRTNTTQAHYQPTKCMQVLMDFIIAPVCVY